jgi:hypothetical protein
VVALVRAGLLAIPLVVIVRVRAGLVIATVLPTAPVALTTAC